uniref:THAP-type domain-containing protein n=1 Tax=Amphilophus citrinellus TaxID=61819 RepID=A0A3Q0RSN2_AMPCI
MPGSFCAIRCTNRRRDKLGVALTFSEHIEFFSLLGTAAKSNDPLSRDWVPSIFSHTPATKKRKREKYMNSTANCRKRGWSFLFSSAMKQVAVDVVEQHCDNQNCKDKIESLQKECNKLKEENWIREARNRYTILQFELRCVKCI